MDVGIDSLGDETLELKGATFGNRLREARITRGYATQKEFAQACWRNGLTDVYEVYISRWERDHVLPRIDTLRRLSKLLHVSIDMLLHGTF